MSGGEMIKCFDWNMTGVANFSPYLFSEEFLEELVIYATE
jgi:hypothetical protein